MGDHILRTTAYVWYELRGAFRSRHTVSYGGAVKVVSNLDLGPRLSSMLTQMAAPPTALSGVGIGLRRWRAGGSRAMGRSRRSTGAAALLPVGLGLTSLQVPRAGSSRTTTSAQGMQVAGANHRTPDLNDPF